MGRLTKAGFARAKSELGLKGKLTRKQVQRVFKKAIKKLGRTRRRVSKTGKVYYTKPKRRKKSKSKRRVRRTARKKSRKGGKSLQRTVFKWLRVGALLAPAINDIMRGTHPAQKAVFVIESYSGYNIDKHQFNIKWLMRGWTPFIMTSLLTYGIPKLMGIIRRM